MKPFAWLADYDRSQVRVDLVAGITVWALLVPQALAYGQLSGLPAVHGLYAALGACALYGLYGTSKHLNVGPEATVATLVASTLTPLAGGDEEAYIALAAILAVFTGVALGLGGLFKLGFVTRLLSVPVLTGYITGSAIVILGGQLDDLLGIAVDVDQYHTTIGAIVDNLGDTNEWDLGVGVATIVALYLLKFTVPKVPSYLVVVILAIGATAIWNLDDEGLTVVGDIDGGLPTPTLGGIDVFQVLGLIAPALAIALLAYVDSISTVKAIAQKEGYEVDPNKEFYGLAGANIGAGILQGFSVNGSQSRSFTAVDAGGKSQVASWFVAVLVLVTVLFLTEPFEFLPKAALAGIVIVVAIGLIDVKGFVGLWKVRRSDFAYALATALGVVVLGMLPGVGIAIVLSLFDVARRALKTKSTELVRVPGTDNYMDTDDVTGGERVPGLLVERFDAPLMFANVDSLIDAIDEAIVTADPPIEAVLLSAGAITDIDVTAMQSLADFHDQLRERNVQLAIARMRPGFHDQIVRAGSILDYCDAVYYEIDDGVDAFREGRFAADGGILTDDGRLAPGIGTDDSDR